MRIKLKEWAKQNDVKLVLSETGKVKVNDSPELLSILESTVFDCVAPALCDEGCEVEPDGTCSHGGPSIALVCGIV